MAHRKPIRVLFVESTTELGGAQIALLTMLRHLDRRAVAPFFASLGFGSGDMPERVAAMGIPVFKLPPGRMRSLTSTAAKVFQLIRIIAQNGVDIVFGNSGHPLMFARLAAVATARPCVWWVHCHNPVEPLKGSAVAFAEQLIGADALYANSEHTARLLAQTFPERRPRIVRCGIDVPGHRFRPDERDSARSELGLSNGTPLVGIFGRLQPWKGQHVFLQAAGALKRKGWRCRYAVVGGSLFGLNPEYATRLREMGGRLDLNGDVMFLGHRDDTARLMSACDVVVHASIEPEPWGLVVAEAMAAGRAVVASAAGGPRETIRDGQTGLLVQPDNPAALASSLETLLRDSTLRERLGAAASAYASEHFDAASAARVLADELLTTHAIHSTRQ